MSADNGIYILVSEGPEYRVAHAQAIENINWNEATKSSDDPNYFNPEEVKRYFGRCAVFTNPQDAQKEAFRIEEEISKSMCPILEYGISMIMFPGKFPKSSSEIAKEARNNSTLPKWCLRAISYRASEDGHASGQQEVDYIEVSMIADFETQFKKAQGT